MTEVTCLNRTISGGYTNFTLGDLRPYTSYNCSMLVFNNQGRGPPSWVELATRKQGNMTPRPQDHLQIRREMVLALATIDTLYFGVS